MKTNLHYRWAGVALLALLLAGPAATRVQAQGGGQGTGLHTWPDSLEMVTVTGVVIIDNTFAHPLYYLDENSDATADYHLSFGPWWYDPDGVERPEAGATVTLTGALQTLVDPGMLTTIIVFDLDGVTWRVPIEYGLLGWNAEPFWPAPTNDTLTVTGTVFIDTTYFYTHYYLDTDGDTLPEYRLGFGPPFFEPASGAVRPAEGDEVTVFGILHEGDAFDLIAVYELDGLVWRVLGEPAAWAGGWMRATRGDTARAYCMNNRQSWIDFPPGNFGQGMGGPNWPDSLFVQFWEIHPDSLPGPIRDRIFAGLHIQVHDRDRIRLMDGRFGGENGMMRFEKQHQVRISYFDEDLAANDLMESTIELWAWDATTEDWVVMTDATIDPTENTVVFETTDLASYYALAAEVTGVAVEGTPELPASIALRQNYPNPFNPSTTIPYVVSDAQRIELAVFDALGRRVALLVDEVKPAGEYQAVFDARHLPSGVYVYRLKGADRTLRRELVVVK
ncbi:MAG: T9SS type A sorting domain-containing protein [Rhodothermales bacterium]